MQYKVIVYNGQHYAVEISTGRVSNMGPTPALRGRREGVVVDWTTTVTEVTVEHRPSGSTTLGRGRARWSKRYPDTYQGWDNVPTPDAPEYFDEEQPMTTYQDGNPKSVQGAKKVPLALVPSTASAAMAAAFADGCRKYGKANWRDTGVSAEVYVNAAQRHLALWYDGGEQHASDSGCHHLGHAMACLAILIDAEAVGKLIDDRPTPVPNLETFLMNKESK